MVANNSRGEFADVRGGKSRKEDATQGALTGGVTGGVAGGALGLLVGIGALAIPGIGPVLAAGPLAAALSTAAVGAGVGAAAGGLIGGLVDMGVPDEDANFYAEGVRRGGTLVSVSAEDSKANRAYDLMQRHGAVDINQRGAEWRKSGWTRFDANAQSYNNVRERTDVDIEQFEAERAVGGGSFESFDHDFRSNFDANFARSGYSYDQFAPIYRYGYTLGGSRRYAGKDWSAVESDARRQWEERNPGTWDQFKDAVRYAWDRSRRVR
jgi:hypothetical protein